MPSESDVMKGERHDSYLVPREQVERRIASLQRAMQTEELALAWIDHLVDRLYFTGSAQEGILLVPADAPPTFHVRKSLSRAEREAGVAVQPYPGSNAFMEEVGRLAGPKGRVGLAMDVTPATTYARLQRTVDAAGLTDISGAVRLIRSIKSPWEVEQIRRASDQVATLFGEIGTHIRPGMTELELTGRIEGRLRSLGHSGTVRVRRPGSDITMGVVVSGASGLYPTSFNGPVGAEGPYPNSPSGAGWKRLAAGETVMLDLVTTHNGYHADTTRTFFLGDAPPDGARRAHDFCCEVWGWIGERMRPGNVCSEVFLEVRSLIEERGEPQGFMGFDENRVRFFGHGVGLELDELPVLAKKIDLRIAPGMVVAVEPKAFLEGVGPVGIENTVVVTDEGCEALCATDNGLHVLGV
jgi:Xaa-Pro aminopeptidase